MSSYISILRNAIYNHYLFEKMYESVLIFTQTNFIKSILDYQAVDYSILNPGFRSFGVIHGFCPPTKASR